MHTFKYSNFFQGPVGPSGPIGPQGDPGPRVGIHIDY